MGKLVVEEPLEAFIGRDYAECKGVRFYAQNNKVEWCDYGSSVAGVLEIGEHYISLVVFVVPKGLVELHGIEVCLHHMWHQVGVPCSFRLMQ